MIEILIIITVIIVLIVFFFSKSPLNDQTTTTYSAEYYRGLNYLLNKSLIRASLLKILLFLYKKEENLFNKWLVNSISSSLISAVSVLLVNPIILLKIIQKSLYYISFYAPHKLFTISLDSINSTHFPSNIFNKIKAF